MTTSTTPRILDLRRRHRRARTRPAARAQRHPRPPSSSAPPLPAPAARPSTFAAPSREVAERMGLMPGIRAPAARTSSASPTSTARPQCSAACRWRTSTARARSPRSRSPAATSTRCCSTHSTEAAADAPASDGMLDYRYGEHIVELDQDADKADGVDVDVRIGTPRALRSRRRGRRRAFGDSTTRIRRRGAVCEVPRRYCAFFTMQHA